MSARTLSLPRHLAIRAPNWVGDLVMATPVLVAAEAALRAGRCERVSILVREHLAPVLGGGPLAELVVPVGGSAAELATLRALAPDAIALLSNSFGAAWRAFRAHVPVRAGAALSARRWLLTHAVVPPTQDGRRVPIPTAHLLRDVAGLVGLAPDTLHPRLWVEPASAARVGALLSELGIERDDGYVVCAPGAAYGAAKLWPPAAFARALDLIHAAHGWRAVISGAPGEEPLAQAVARATRHGALALAGQTGGLEGLKALVRGARLLLVGDSGPRWFAAAFDVPCVSVMGPNFPELTASSLERCAVVRVEGLECAPCLERTCPLAHHRCMQDLAPESVVLAAERVLERARRTVASGATA
jgi:heptosyltransferase-2